MQDAYQDLREPLLFGTAPGDFADASQTLRRQLASDYHQATAEARDGVARAAAGLCLDLQSYLPRWRLQPPGQPSPVTPEALQAEALEYRRLLVRWHAEDMLRAVADEEALLKRSNFLRMSHLADDGTITTRWGYDYAHGIRGALRRGALLVTTNPPLVNIARQEHPAHWGAVREGLRRAHPGAEGERLASLFSAQVVLANCRILRPIYAASGGRYGYVNLQVSPHAARDAQRMAEDIEWLHGVLRDELGGTPNVVFKVPGTRAALDTVRRVTAKGIGVTITLGFSVDQHLAFAEAIEGGCAPVSFLVMMNGRLDDPVRDELQAAGVAAAADLATWAATAVVRRSYGLLFGSGRYRRSALLVASLRGPWNVAAAVASGPAPVFITAFPDKTAEYDAEPRAIRSAMDEPLPPAVLSGLSRSRLFCQAVEPGALGVDGFDSYHPVQITLKAFAAAWDELAAWLAG